MPKQFRFRFTLALATVVSLGLVSQPFFWRVGAARSLAATPTLLAPPLEVTSMEDSGTGSLRAAIEAANSSPADDVITFAINGTITLTSELGIASIANGGKLTIIGNGENQTIISGNNATQVINVFVDANLTLINLRIEKGRTSLSSGGGILNQGALTMNRCTLANNYGLAGGGIYHNGTALTLSYCTLSGNSSSSDYGGGGIYNPETKTMTLTNCSLEENSAGTGPGGAVMNFGTATLTGCTLSGNSAGTGGGLAIKGTANLTNCTISGNTVSGVGNGGGIINGGTAELTNCTIADNAVLGGTFNKGGGVTNLAVFRIRNTIISGNRAANFPDIFNNNTSLTNIPNLTITSLGHNIVENIFKVDFSGDLSNDLLSYAANLGPLQFNGGPTKTMKLMFDSPGIDAGTSVGAPPTDQRGFGRAYPYNRPDIGAYEYAAQDLAPVTEINGVITLQLDPYNAAPTLVAQELIAAIELANQYPTPTIIKLKCGPYQFYAAHHWEYGPNALPPITSEITIEGNGAVLNSNETTRLRFFYVSGGLSYDSVLQLGLPAGKLTLQDLTLQNGKQKGGDSALGGGGAGMGGAIFNQGTLTLARVTLTGNKAAGGNLLDNTSLVGGGGMGQDAQGESGGGFGGSPLGAGGTGGAAASGGGGGGGFLPNANGAAASSFDGGGGGGGGKTGGGGGGFGGGSIGASGGDGGGGGVGQSDSASRGGGFGFGGGSSGGGGGGGGIGSGGGYGSDGGGGGGGFGGGGGDADFGRRGSGGFGGGGGSLNGLGGFGGGNGSIFGGGGGGFGGAIFNHRGTLTLTNCTLTNNTVQGGGVGFNGTAGVNGGSGFGGALFNLNGTVTIASSTLAANTVIAGSKNGNGVNGQADGGAVYNLAYGNKIEDGSPSTATVTISNSILANSVGGNDLFNDKRDGAGTNTATVTFSNGNLVMAKSSLNSATEAGTPTVNLNPNFGAEQTILCQPTVLPLQANSPALNAASVDPNVTSDQLGVLRQGNAPDLGAYEFTAAPTITLSTSPTLNAGASLSNTQLATVSDADQDRNTLQVTATPQTGSGVTVGPLSVDSSGNVKATVSANCAATTSTFTLKVTDNGTLFDEQTLTVNVNADVMLPDTNLTGLPGSLSDVNVSFTFSGTDNCTVSRFECKLDNGGWTSCTSGQSYSNLSSGQHMFSVKAIDAAGNEDDSPASYTWTVFAASCGTVVNPVMMPAATKGVQFVQTLSAAPTGSYVFSLMAGQLPPGINLVNTLGIYSLRGTPTTSGRYTFTIRAKKNNSTCEGARTYTIAVP